jgi:DNA invertase Pin-like site-specific DNA recombinase
MKIGYARTSTLDQKYGLEAQIEELKAAGVEKVFQEQVSSVDAKRLQLEAAIDFCRKGDELIVTKLDRLARSVANLMEIVERLKAKEVSLVIRNLGIDTNTATGKLMLTLLGGISAFEREINLERQRAGIERARRAGKYRGRAPTARRKSDEIKALRAEGIKITEIAERLEVSERSVYRALAS